MARLQTPMLGRHDIVGARWPRTGAALGAWWISEDRCIVVEGKLLERHGSTAAETVGQTLREVVPEAAWEVLEPTYRATLRGETITTTIEALDGQGGDETTFVPLRDGARVIGGMAIIRDTTPGRG